MFIIHLITKDLLRSQRKDYHTKILFGIGIITFLLAFTSGNIVGSFTENWEYAQFGLFGMPLFMGIISYSIIRFKSFDTKTFSAQILVSILMLLTSGILFLRTIERVRIVTIITLLFVGVLGFFLIRSVKREIDQRQKIEKLVEELAGANNKLRELDQMKSEFLSLATHQIRAPLTAIKGYSSMLLEGDFGPLPEKAHESVNIIMKSCQNLINVVGDFLNISRIEQGRMVYEKTVFDISKLVSEVASEMRPNISNAGLSIEINTEEGSKTKVKADKDKIKQVIGNIIDNAVKYTVHGGIKISIFSENNKAKVAIKDTGVGIDPTEVNKLFSKFSRTKDANRTNVIGTGLGLYIAKKMTEAHQGDIKVESEGVGKGSTFTIELPLFEEV
jgi:signal transduction histidine kinase